MRLSYHWLLISLIFIVGLSRFVLLDHFPVGVSHDETEYILSSASYAYRGTDLSGIGFPLSLIKTHTLGEISPIPPLFLAPYFYLVGVSQFSARFIYALISLITAFVLYRVGILFFKNTRIALVAMLLFLASPWGFFLSRWTADTPFALLFFLTGLYFFLKPDLSLKKIAVIVLAFALGFFSYNGAKILFLPLILILTGYRYWFIQETKEHKKRLLWVGIASLALFFGYFIVSFVTPDSTFHSRNGEIIFFNSKLLTERVNYFRSVAIPDFFTSLFVNKFTVACQIIFQKYLTVFSPLTLFVQGDPDIVYRTDMIGLVMPFEMVTMLAGLFVLYRSYRRQLILLGMLIVIAPLPTALSGNSTSLMQRSFFLLPLLSLISGVGVYGIFQFLRKYIHPNVTVTLFLTSFLSFYFYFLHFYFFQWPVLSLEGFALQPRQGVTYLHLAPVTARTTVIATDPRAMFLQYIFYADRATQTTFFTRRFDAFLKKDYEIPSLRFTDHCPDYAEDGVSYLIQRESSPCKRLGLPGGEIISQRDGKMLWQIHRDVVCAGGTSGKALHRATLGDYLFSGMERRDFCTDWIRSL